MKKCKYKILDKKDLDQRNFVELFNIIDYNGATPINRMRKRSQTFAYWKIINHYYVCPWWPNEINILSPNIVLFPQFFPRFFPQTLLFHQIQRYLRFSLRGCNFSHIANVITLVLPLLHHICFMRKIVNIKTV